MTSLARSIARHEVAHGSRETHPQRVPSPHRSLTARGRRCRRRMRGRPPPPRQSRVYHPGVRFHAVRRMRALLLATAVVVAILAVACVGKSRSPEVPAGAEVTNDGVRWIRLRPGQGRLGTDGRFWSVDWSYIPPDDFGQHVYNGSPDTSLYDPFRSNLLTMREGELRRVWLPDGRGGHLAAHLHLEAVFQADSNGEPITRNE
jgi:hypothetical protein